MTCPHTETTDHCAPGHPLHGRCGVVICNVCRLLIRKKVAK